MGKLYKENWYQKWQKKQIWTISRTCTGIGTGVYRYRYRGVPVQVQGCTGTPHQRPTCTSTGQQNVTCTGTGPRCTGTCEPKMTRLFSFCVFKPKFIHH